jgi:hypothetical protein
MTFYDDIKAYCGGSRSMMYFLARIHFILVSNTSMIRNKKFE